MPSTSREDPQAWKEQVIVIQAYYDAMSVVPARAPGAENASGIVALLKLIETLGASPKLFRAIFLATSGHFQGLEASMISSIVTAGKRVFQRADVGKGIALVRPNVISRSFEPRSAKRHF